MPYLISINHTPPTDQSLCGEKAVCLGELVSAGLDVPSAFCVTTDAYRDTIAYTLHDKITARIASAEIDDPTDLEAATDDIRAWLANAPIPTSLFDEIQSAVAALDAKSFAVRASRVVEDVPNPTQSGLAQAYLGIVGIDNVLHAILDCWATPWNSRAIYYRHRKKIPTHQVTMAVVVQTMVAADASGVMFTTNPLTGASDEILIDATWGLGEAVIAARWKPDHFVIGKNELAIRARTIPNKTVMDVIAPDGTRQTIGIPDEQQNTACLNDTQACALAALGKQIETRFKDTQDIEWCRVGEKLWILQTRPLKKK